VEGPSTNSAGQHDQGVSTAASRVAPPHLETRLLLQERKEGHLPDDDHTQSLRLALQGQDHPLHGQVSYLGLGRGGGFVVNIWTSSRMVRV